MAHQRTRPNQVPPAVDLGGGGPVVHLAHAYGFPPGTYRPPAKTLVDRYHVLALPSRPLWPGSRPESVADWHPLADDLIQGLDYLGLAGVVGVGHSLGGVLTLQAAVSRPDLFRAIVLVDPVILPPFWLWLLRWFMRPLGLHRRQPLLRGALRQRRTWPSHQACCEHYQAKPFLAPWPDASLRAYVEAGTRGRDDGRVELAYPPEWEAHIFATMPTDVWRAVSQLRTPALVIRGEGSGAWFLARFVVIPGAGHLAPIERPAETSAVIRDFLDTMEAQTANSRQQAVNGADGS